MQKRRGIGIILAPPAANVVPNCWRRVSKRATCPAVYSRRWKLSLRLSKERAAAGPSAPVTGRQTGRRKAKLKFTSSLLPWFVCVLVSRKWPQLESADWVSVAGRQRASCPGIHLGQKAARINIELQLVEAVPLKPTHSPVGNTQWKVWIQVGKRASWQQLTCHCTEERSETLPPHQLW